MQTKYLTEFLDSLINDKKIPGFDCIIHQHGKEIYRHSNGYADLETKAPITQNTLYNIYSSSKVITCVAALQLFERGKLRLDDKLFQYFPEYEKMFIKSENGSKLPANNSITVKDLFCMTAGFNYVLDSDSIERFKKETNGKCPTILFPQYHSDELLEFEPSTRWNYGLCHDVLGALIEKISGMKLSEYMKENIFDPAGMKNTSFHLNQLDKGLIATQYRFNPEANKAEKCEQNNAFKFGTEYESGGAGIITIVDDYIAFEDALCAGKLITYPTIKLMRLDHLSPEANKYYGWGYPHGMSYGLGVRTIINQAEACTTAGFGSFGWDGAAGSFVNIDPENELCVFYAQHMLNSDNYYIHSTLRNIIYSFILGK